MERSTFALVFLFVFLGAILFLQTRIYHEALVDAKESFVATQGCVKEGFGSTSPGTMVQLQTSHVPTEEDIAMILREKKRAEEEARRMTSGFIDLNGAPY
jgi:hypothetical protein